MSGTQVQKIVKTRFPLAQTVFGILDKHYAEQEYELIVMHPHGHSEHVAAA